jgi:hypothetical protein
VGQWRLNFAVGPQVTGQSMRKTFELVAAGLTLASVAIVVSSVIAPLANTLANTDHRSDRERRRSRANLYFLGKALEGFAQDHGGVLPPMDAPTVLRRALVGYTQVTESPSGDKWSALVQPGILQPYPANGFLAGKKLSRFRQARSWTVAFYESREDSWGTRLVLTLDGRVHRVRRTEWPLLRKASRLP